MMRHVMLSSLLTPSYTAPDMRIERFCVVAQTDFVQQPNNYSPQ